MSPSTAASQSCRTQQHLPCVLHTYFPPSSVCSALLLLPELSFEEFPMCIAYPFPAVALFSVHGLPQSLLRATLYLGWRTFLASTYLRYCLVPESLPTSQFYVSKRFIGSCYYLAFLHSPSLVPPRKPKTVVRFVARIPTPLTNASSLCGMTLTLPR